MPGRKEAPIPAARFAGRRALVTGAASGLGREVALRLAAEGARCLLLDRDAAGLAATAAGAPGAQALAGDVTAAADLAAAAAQGPFDLLATAAGVLGPTTPLHEVTEAEWDRLFAVNVKGTWLTVKAVLPGMLAAGRGAIVTFGSGAGLVANTVFPAYGAAKAAVINLTRSLAAAHAAQGIRANCVCPGPIETPMLRESFAAAGAEAAAREAWTRARNPMGRFGSPAEVAAAALFLLSEEAAYVNGVALPVDGGRLA
jgi:NAD(P)-dependent dehydrogenase (short-subunit alcohol dehydrogenase family)